MTEGPAALQNKRRKHYMGRSMFTATSGLQSLQTGMDVIGNNIANVNTPGFRSSNTVFKDMFYQTLKDGTATENPSQVGYGVEVGSIDKLMTRQGASQTGRALDLYIDGDGFFAVNDNNKGTGGTLYTRVGNFHVDSSGNLVDADNKYVLSSTDAGGTVALSRPVNLESGNSVITMVTNSGKIIPIDKTSYSELSNIAINPDGSFTGTIGSDRGTLYTSVPVKDQATGVEVNYANLSNIQYNAASSTYTATYNGSTITLDVPSPEKLKISLVNFANPDGLTEVGNSDFSSGESSGLPQTITVGGDVLIRSGELELSNVDLAKEFTNMIITERGYQSNAKVITTSDEMVQELVNLKR